MALSRFSFPTAITFGPGARAEVADDLAMADCRRPLVVTDQGVASLPMFAAMLDDLAGAGLAPAPFSDIWGNPVTAQVTAGVAAFRSHDADAIVGFGGGAALDVAKAIGLMATHPGELFDYEDGLEGARPIEPVLPYLVALPTTAGTGSEVGRSAVIADDITHVKKVIFGPELLARSVFADPELTVGLPADITAATGMDALTHCVEAYLAKDYHPICDGIALEGLRLAARSLARCVHQPDDLEARGDMMMASMMGAIAFQKGLGLTHSCAHALGTATEMHHGLANGVMVDHALRFNLNAVPERFETLATTVGLDRGDAFLDWLADLKVDLGIPSGLVGAGVDQAKAGELAQLAVEDGCHLNNPRPVGLDDFRSIFADAFA